MTRRRLLLVNGLLAFLFTRASTAAAFGIGWYLLGLPHNFGKTHHFDALVVLVLGVMVLARAGDAYSLDRRFFARGPAPSPSGEYRWPVRAAWLLMAFVFCSAGIAKLRHGGVAWVLSDNMATVLLQHAYPVASHEPLSGLGSWLGQYPRLCSVMALFTVAIEVGFRSRWSAGALAGCFRPPCVGCSSASAC